jgi:hypothetical protein
MKLQVVRYNFQDDFTDGLLFIDGKFIAHTLEDEKRDVKVWGETCTPVGEYEITLRTVGRIHNNYLRKFGEDWHKGTLWVRNVPNFKYILIHIGNTDEHTAGCLLVGSTNNIDDKGFIGQSANAYKKMYPIVRDALLKGEKVTIEYTEMK